MLSWRWCTMAEGDTTTMTGGRSKASRRLDLAAFFSRVVDLPYVVVRGTPEDLLHYHPGSDIDIFCYDKPEFGRQVLAFANDYLDFGYEVHLEDSEVGDQSHIDLHRGGRLEVRFDLYGELPPYRRSHVNPALFFSVIEQAETLELQHDREIVTIQVPSRVDDLLLRYLEYIEYYEERPEKLRHLDYILEAVEKLPKARIGFLEKLHRYTSLPECTSYVPEVVTRRASPDRASRGALGRLKRRIISQIKAMLGSASA